MAMDPQRSGRQGAGSGAATLAAAKVAVVLLGVISCGLVVRAAVPAVHGALSTGVPRFWAAFRSSLGHPFVFVALNVIIFAIWKLSDLKQHLPPEEKSPGAENLAKVKSIDVAVALAEPLVRKPSPMIWHEIPSPPITPLSSISTPSPAPEALPQNSLPTPSTAPGEEPFALPELKINKMVDTPPESAVEVVEQYAPSAMEVAEAVDGDENSPTMEAMWKAIMEKTPRKGEATQVAVAAASSPPATPRRGLRQPETAAAPSAPVVVRGREPSLTSPEELNRRFDDFIKKNYEQMRRKM